MSLSQVTKIRRAANIWRINIKSMIGELSNPQQDGREYAALIYIVETYVYTLNTVLFISFVDNIVIDVSWLPILVCLMAYRSYAVVEKWPSMKNTPRKTMTSINISSRK